MSCNDAVGPRKFVCFQLQFVEKYISRHAVYYLLHNNQYKNKSTHWIVPMKIKVKAHAA